jgi:hypothetical protein
MPAKTMADARRCEDDMSCDRDTKTGAIKSLLLDRAKGAGVQPWPPNAFRFAKSKSWHEANSTCVFMKEKSSNCILAEVVQVIVAGQFCSACLELRKPMPVLAAV